MSTDMARTATAVLPTRNNLDELIRCVESLQAQSRPPTRIVVCVDGSTDGTIEHFAGDTVAGPVVVHVATHPGNTHRGRAATRNLALPLIDTDYVWFVDSDMVLAPDALAEHFALVESRPCVSQGHVNYANADEAPWAAISMSVRTTAARTAQSSRSPGSRPPTAWSVRHMSRRSAGSTNVSRLRWGGLRLRVSTGTPVGRAVHQQQEGRGHDRRVKDHRVSPSPVRGVRSHEPAPP